MSDHTHGEKLQKILARAGLGSRRDLERVIAAGRVSVNGEIAQLGDRAVATDKIAVDGRRVKVLQAEQRQPRVLIYNKPEGEICTRKDPQGRPSVFDRLPVLKGERWISIGRLDFNTTGLLLFTTEGELANALMHPSANIDREYLCRVLGEADGDTLQRLRDGVLLDDGVAQFTDIVDGGGDGANHWYYVCLMEGRNREVRRLWESQDLQVNRLKRVRFGSVFLPSTLRQGQWQELSSAEVAQLYEFVGLTPPAVKPLTPKEKQHIARQKRRNKPVKPGAQDHAPRRSKKRAPGNDKPRKSHGKRSAKQSRRTPE